MTTLNLKTRLAKQVANNANTASGTKLANANTAVDIMQSSEAGSSNPVALNVIIVVQSTLEKAMREMAQVSSILQDLQVDV